jgi:drug/metabolite transporter (DMT)-like permease
MLIASLIFRQEKLTVKKILSCIVAFAGIIIMNLDGLSLNFNLLGDGLVVLGTAFYSLSVVITRLVAQDEDPIVLCSYQMALGGIGMLLIGALFGGGLDLLAMLPIILCLSLIYAVSYSLWTVLIKFNPASKVAIHSFMIPVFGVIFSAIMLQEQGGVNTLNLILALVLVCVGILIWGKSSKD